MANDLNVIKVYAVRTARFYGKPMIAGHFYTVAGVFTARAGFSGDGGPATKATLFDPPGIAPRGKGLVVLDVGNNRVRAVTG